MSQEERSAALRGLLNGDIPVAEARSILRQFPWDSDVELQKLTRKDLSRMLDRFLAGSISDTGVEEWAEAIEGRDDIGFETDAHESLRQAIFELANPELTSRLTSERAQELKELLAGRGPADT